MLRIQGVELRESITVPTWVVVKIMVPFWVPNIVRHLIFRVPKKGTIILKTTHMTSKPGLAGVSGFCHAELGFVSCLHWYGSFRK